VSAGTTLSYPGIRDHVQGTWIPFTVGFYFSFRLCTVLVSVRILGFAPSTGAAISIGLDLLLFGLVGFDSIGPYERPAGSILRLPAVRWVLLFLTFSGLSLLWSATASPANSLVYWCGLAIDVAMTVLLLRGDVGGENACAALRGFIWSSCLLAVVAWMMPTAADLRLGDEQFFNTNQIGNLCAFAIFFAQYLTRQKRGQWRAAKLLLVITLVRSLSKATLAAFVVSEACLLIMDRSMSRRTKILLASSSLLIVLAFWGTFEAYYDVYTTAGNQAETLTGRTAIWLYAANATFDHPYTPWIGHGIDAWWKVVPPFGNQFFEARHAENEILQQFYAYGCAGVLLLAGIYGSLYRHLRRLQSSPTKMLFLCVLIFVLVRGLAEAEPFDLLLPLWSVVLISTLAEEDRTRGAQTCDRYAPCGHAMS
jgi:exopolysaccharide production protein ExoQ